MGRCKIQSALIQCQPEEYREDLTKKLLTPLLRNLPVALLVKDKKLFVKKRVKKPVLFIIPAQIMGLDKRYLIIGLQGYGCEVVDTYRLRTFHFIRIGLSASAAKILVTTLKQMFTLGEHENGKSR